MIVLSFNAPPQEAFRFIFLIEVNLPLTVGLRDSLLVGLDAREVAVLSEELQTEGF